MSIKIDDYLDVEEYNREVADGFISVRNHPTLPLKISNYTNQAQYRGHSDTTRKCRGLIVDDHGYVVARPFEKFYNWQEPEAPDFDEDEVVEVFDKADGSLIIVTNYAGKMVVASRGSFESDQAKIAHRLLLDAPLNGHNKFEGDHGLTTLFELVGPSNPIVLGYPKDTLLYLGDIHNKSGDLLIMTDFYGNIAGFDSVQHFGEMTYKEALSLPMRSNAEGYIIRNKRGTVKMKQADYVEAHRIIFGLTYKGLIEMLSEGTMDEFMDRVPDELFDKVDTMRDELVSRHETMLSEAMNEYVAIAGIESQRDFALANNGKYRGECFALRNGKPISKATWKRIKEEYKGR